MRWRAARARGRQVQQRRMDCLSERLELDRTRRRRLAQAVLAAYWGLKKQRSHVGGGARLHRIASGREDLAQRLCSARISCMLEVTRPARF